MYSIRLKNPRTDPFLQLIAPALPLCNFFLLSRQPTHPIGGFVGGTPGSAVFLKCVLICFEVLILWNHRILVWCSSQLHKANPIPLISFRNALAHTLLVGDMTVKSLNVALCVWIQPISPIKLLLQECHGCDMPTGTFWAEKHIDLI